ncbi:hypothetical protein V6R21_06420 [Limibacter armeniacum]|uniref:hypothetical protein n=1 Tax=Limibacter armeniacum TaxID=466084 RepID=UPI002FE69CA9
MASQYRAPQILREGNFTTAKVDRPTCKVYILTAKLLRGMSAYLDKKVVRNQFESKLEYMSVQELEKALELMQQSEEACHKFVSKYGFSKN